MENMLRWLSDPANDHALMAVLRSPMFAVNDGVLHKLLFRRRSSLWRRLKAAVKEPDFIMLKGVVATLDQLRECALKLPLGELARKILAVTAYDII